MIYSDMDLVITKQNEAYIKIQCDDGIAQELHEYFSFYVPNFQFTPQFRKKLWDGKIRLFDLRSRLLFHGLITYVEKFCRDRKYTYHLDTLVLLSENWSEQEAKGFIQTLSLPEEIQIREYQFDTIVHAIRNRRQLIVSPTGSGKSLVLYCLTRYFLSRDLQKVLIVVPTTSLVEQLTSDFRLYGWEVDQFVHKQYAGKEKTTHKPVTITTWQSIYEFPASYFEQFDAVLGDECHLFKAKSLQSIMTKLTRTMFRIGTTGTLDGSKTNRLVLEGVFGPVYQATRTKDLMESETLAEIKIKALILKYDEATCKQLKSSNYQEELDFVVRHQKRNKFIANLTLSLPGNTLILFQFIDKHGEILYDMIRSFAPERSISYVHGGVEADERERIRQYVNQSSNAIVLGSSGTFSTGVNIPNLHNIIFASPSKSRIRVLQSIGRGLRRTEEKSTMTLFDIADDLRTGKPMNYLLQHYIERLKIYDEEQFTYQQYYIDLTK